MTISSTSRTAGPFTGTGALVNYPFSFKVFTTADVRVVHTTAAGVDDAVWVLGTNYGVTLNANQNANPGGYITPAVALPAGEKLTLTSGVAALQGLALTTGGNWDPRSVEDALDKLTVLIQQVSSLAAGVPPGVTSAVAALPSSVAAGGGVSATLPAPQAGAVLAWNSTGTGITNATVTAGGGGTTSTPSVFGAAVATAANIAATQTPTASVAETPATFFLPGSDYTVPGTAWQTFSGGVEYLYIGPVSWPGPTPYGITAGQIVLNGTGGFPVGTVLAPAGTDTALSPSLYVAADGTCRALASATLTSLSMPRGYVVCRQ